MKLIHAAFSLVFFLSSGNAFSQNNNPLVSIIGEMKPPIEVSESDLQLIANGLNDIHAMEKIKITAEAPFDGVKDRPAFQAASREISKTILMAAKTVADLRTIVYKLTIDLKIAEKGGHAELRTTVVDAYQGHFQKQFTKLLELFLGPQGNSYNEALSNAMEMCYTTSCITVIANAQLDLVEFGHSLNSRIDIESYTRWDVQVRGFQSSVVKDAVKNARDQFLKVNQQQSAYTAIMRAALVPFVEAAQGVSKSSAQLISVIGSPKLTYVKFYANGIQKKRKEWEYVREIFEDRMRKNISHAISSQSGGLKFNESLLTVDEPQQSTPSQQAPSSSSVDGHASPFRDALVDLNARLEKLNSVSTVDPGVVRNMVTQILRSRKEETFEWFYQLARNEFDAIRGFEVSGSTWFYGKLFGVPGVSEFEISSNSLNLDGKIYARVADYVSGVNLIVRSSENELVVDFIKDEKIVWLFPYVSSPNYASTKYVVWIELDLKDYLVTRSDGKVLANPNPPLPKHYLGTIK